MKVLALELLTSPYLLRRRQMTLIGNTYIDYVDAKCGVPQIKVLGPTLFLIYVNNIDQVSDVSDVYS